MKIEEPINTDEDDPSPIQERPSQMPVSLLVTELFRSIAIDETDVSFLNFVFTILKFLDREIETRNGSDQRL